MFKKLEFLLLSLIFLTHLSFASGLVNPYISFPATGGFIPSDLEGLTLWIDADNNSSFNSGSISNEDRVPTWNDVSASGYSFIQGTAVDQPIYYSSGQNSKPYVSFDGAGFRLNCASINPFDQDDNYIFFVMRFYDVGNTVHWQWNSDSNNRVGFERQSSLYPRFNYSNQNLFSTSTDYSGAVHYFRFSYVDSTTTRAIYVNGSLNTSSNSADVQLPATTADFGLGRPGNVPGGQMDLYEMIIVAGTMTSTEIANVESYLANKYGL